MFNISAEKPFIVTGDIANYLRQGAGTGISFTGMSTQEIVSALTEYQKGFLRENFGGEKIDELIPQAGRDLISNKINTIVGMMHAAAVANLNTHTWIREASRIEYTIKSTGISFTEKMLKGSPLGTFIQDIMVFRNLDLPSNQALPDMVSILTELKSYSNFEKGIHAGDITTGLDITNKSAEEIAKARNILENSLNIEAAAIIELYIKMRNLLLIVPDFYEGEAHYAAIILYIELLISKLSDLMKAGRDAEKEKKVSSKSDEHYSILDTPLISVVDSGVKETTTSDNRLILQRGFSIGFSETYSNLYSSKNEKGRWSKSGLDFYQKMENAFKNLEDMYAIRKDILSYVRGNYPAAKEFFGVMANEEIALVNMETLKKFGS